LLMSLELEFVVAEDEDRSLCGELFDVSESILDLDLDLDRGEEPTPVPELDRIWLGSEP